MEKIKEILETKKCLKLILGAGNEDVKEIEKLIYIYAKAGFNMFDISAKPEVVKAAKRALKLAQVEAFICVSVGLADDIHLKKAVINKQKCNNCSKCISVCPHNAIFEEDNSYIVDEKRCIGCSVCIQNCPFNAIIAEHKYKAPYTMLLPMLSEGIDCVEFHCSSDKTDDIIDNFNKIKSIYNGMLSICLDRSKLGNEGIISLLKAMISDKPDYSYIVQVDGKAMSGLDDSYSTTLQTVAFAQLIETNNLPVYIILSGGTNSKSTKLAKECSVNVNGVALGSYARKIVKEYTERADFFENQNVQTAAINIAVALREELVKYL